MNQRIKLQQLIDAIDPNRDSNGEMIQVVRPTDDWDDYDQIETSSPLLIPFYEAEICEISMEAKDVIRISIDWELLNSKCDRDKR